MRGEGGGHWRLLEAGRVWRGLDAELGQVEIRTSLVAGVHGLVQPSLGVEAVEDNGVDGDSNDFDNDFDESAYKRPVLYPG